MDNEITLKNLQNTYESLRFFAIKDYVLYFKDNDKLYSLPLYTTQISKLNQNIFLLKPRDIYRIIYLLELLSKNEITEYDQSFIVQYTEKYLRLEKERIENNSSDENVLFGLEIPIYKSYDPEFIDKPASLLIQNLLNNHTEEIESGRSQGQKLVLTKSNLPAIIDDTPNNLIEVSKAGFTVALLIALTVILASTYIALFVLNK